jgi:hypothetical protein
MSDMAIYRQLTVRLSVSELLTAAELALVYYRQALELEKKVAELLLCAYPQHCRAFLHRDSDIPAMPRSDRSLNGHIRRHKCL